MSKRPQAASATIDDIEAVRRGQPGATKEAQ